MTRRRDDERFVPQLATLRVHAKEMPPAEAFSTFVAHAWALKDRGQLEDALRVIDAALGDFEHIERESRAEAYNVRGQVLQSLGRLSEARNAHEAMARLAHESSNKSIEGAAFLALGSVAQLGRDAQTARRHYVHALRLLDADGNPREIVQVLLNLAGLRLESGQLGEADELLASMSSVIEKHDVRLRAGYRGLLGNLRVAQGRHAEAATAYRATLRDARRSGDQLLVLKTYQNLGAVHLDLNAPKRALQWYRKGAEAAEAEGGGCLAQWIVLERGVAAAAHAAGDSRTAAASLQAVKRIAARPGTGLTHEASRAAVDLAGLALVDGNAKAAAKLLREAHPGLQVTRDRPWVESFWSHMLAVAALSLSPRQEVDAALDAALGELPRSEKTLRAEVLRDASVVLARLRAFARAKEVLAMSIGTERHVLDMRGRAWGAAQAGALLLSTGGAMEAVSFFTQAARLYSRIGDDQMVFQCRNDSANALTEAGKYTAAIRRYSECQVLARRLRDRAMTAQTSLNLAEALRRKGSPGQALVAIRRAVRAYEGLRDLGGLANAESTHGLVLGDLRRHPEAEHAFRRSAALAQEASDERSLAVALGGLADIQRAGGNLLQAIDLYRRTIGLEQKAKDLKHECETQAGLLVALARLGDAQWKATADRLLYLARQVGRPEVARWAFTEGGREGLNAGHGALAAQLFALSLGMPFDSGLRDGALVEAVTETAIQVIGHLNRHDHAHLGELTSEVTSAATQIGGAVFGRLIRGLLEAGVKGVEEGTAKRARRRDVRRRGGHRARVKGARQQGRQKPAS